MEFSGFREDRAVFDGLPVGWTDDGPDGGGENTPRDPAKQRTFTSLSGPDESLATDLESFARAAGYRLVEPSGSGGHAPLIEALRAALDLAERIGTTRRAPDGSVEITADEARAIVAVLENVMSKAAATCETLGARG